MNDQQQSRADALTKLVESYGHALIKQRSEEASAILEMIHGFAASSAEQPAAAPIDERPCIVRDDCKWPACRLDCVIDSRDQKAREGKSLAELTAPSPADERAAKISDYLNAPGMWAQIYCCAVFVHGWPSDMARGAADEAVKEFGDAACKTVADLTHTLDEVLRVD
ncbi:hypothetical protein [Burkholderia thailandensis]|uniref:hypothetical protein n=1 Tax=Burkholderia thailandensis TaxID=57975 RepID=UPI00217CF89E|nr:hypothetical protein [Burkholderia thailandensis]MCS6516933.1 hypothetical protein [Burkholderia thailandensis]